MADMSEPSEHAALIERIRARVATEQNVLLTKGDPILSVVLIMEEVIKAYGRNVADDLLRNQEIMGTLMQTVVEASKETAGKLITESAAWVAKQITNAGDQVRRDIIQAAVSESNKMQTESRRIHDQVHSMRTEIMDSRRGINVAMVTSVVASLIAVIACVVAVLK